MWGPNPLPRITKGVEPLTKDSTRDPLTNCTILYLPMVVIHGSMQEGEDKTEDKRTATAMGIIMGEIIVVVVAVVALITIVVEQMDGT